LPRSAIARSPTARIAADVGRRLARFTVSWCPRKGGTSTRLTGCARKQESRSYLFGVAAPRAAEAERSNRGPARPRPRIDAAPPREVQREGAPNWTGSSPAPAEPAPPEKLLTIELRETCMKPAAGPSTGGSRARSLVAAAASCPQGRASTASVGAPSRPSSAPTSLRQEYPGCVRLCLALQAVAARSSCSCSIRSMRSK
jgi:hypothetical protein